MQDLLRKARAAREYMTPVLKSSKFLDEGKLTPEEFVTAGDNLTFKCPTWRWESGDPRHRKAYLPEDKQFLVTRGVPCRSRVSVMEASYAKTAASVAVLGGGEEEEGASKDGSDINGTDWTVLTDGNKKAYPGKESIRGAEKSSSPVHKDHTQTGESLHSVSQVGAEEDEDDDSDDDSGYLDMEDFEEQHLVEPDEAAVLQVQPSDTAESAVVENGDSTAVTAGVSNTGSKVKESNIERVRTYDLSITYDNYYKTPRVWLFGFDENGSPLPAEQIFEDIAVDYRKRTVTIDPHPHLHNLMHASIHPCKHAAVMKKIVGAMLAARDAEAVEALTDANSGGGSGSSKHAAPSVAAYLFIFLKFIQSVIPTIDYDFTMTVSFKFDNGGAS